MLLLQSHSIHDIFEGEIIMFKKILVPTDGSPLATQAAMEGIELAKKVGAEVYCVYVARENMNSTFEFSDGKPLSFPSDEEYKVAVKEAAEQFMKPLRESAKAGNVKFTEDMFISNSTAGYIVYAADKNGCDLIFMASKGCAGWENIFMGSVATKVLSTSQIPVLIYKVKKEQLPEKTKMYISPRV